MVETLRYQARCNHRGQWVIIDTVKPEGDQVIDSSEPGLTLDDILSVTHDRSKIASPDYEGTRKAILQRSKVFFTA